MLIFLENSYNYSITHVNAYINRLYQFIDLKGVINVRLSYKKLAFIVIIYRVTY